MDQSIDRLNQIAEAGDGAELAASSIRGHVTEGSNDRFIVLHALLVRALDLGPAEREEWLARLRLEQPDHAAELERLLRDEAILDARGFLLQGVGPQEREGTTLEGRRLGPWTLERPLGQGGMGTVWLARRSDGRFEGTAAVKLLNLALLDPIGAERFRREGTVLARLGHPNIARLLDAGVTEEAQPYLVLEHVQGERIDRYCDARRLNPEQRIERFLDVLGAVAHAHANLIVHRDLKPSNILVTQDGTVKLLDFGVAKLLEDGGAGAGSSSTLTDLGGATALTPEFAAPEQIAGGTVTTATDVYALGVLLYVLLTGRHPTGEGSRTAAEHIKGVLDTEPPRPSSALRSDAAARLGGSVQRFRRLYAGDLDTILLKALKKRPEERYGSVGALAADLRRYLAHEPVSARPDSLWYRSRKFVRRHRAGVALAGLATAALVAAGIVTWLQYLAARRQRDEALFHARLAEAISDFQTALISQIGTTRVSLTDLVDKGVAALARRPPADPRVHAALLMQFADRYGELEQRRQERVLLAQADSAALRSADPQLQARVACAVGKHHTELRETDSARAVLRRAGRILGGLRHIDPQTRVSCLLPAAELAFLEKHPDSAVVLDSLAAATLDSAGAKGTLQFYVVQSDLAEYLRTTGRVREAIALNHASREGLAALGLEGTVLYSSVTNNLAEALAQRGERREAIDLLREVLEETRQADPEGGVHPVVGFNYASELALVDQLDSALAWYQAVAASAKARSFLELERRALLGVARISARLGRPAAARRAFDGMLAIARTQQKPVPRESLFVAASLALADGDTRRAAEGFEAVLRRDGYYEGKRGQASRAPLLELARIGLREGQPRETLDRARALLELAMVDSLAAYRSADVGEASLLLAQAHAALGAADSARIHARAALAALTVGAGPRNPLTLQAGALVDSLEPQVR